MVRRAALGWILFLSLCGAQAAQITQFSPQGRVAVVESIKVMFDAPVIVFGDDQAKAPLTVSCNDASVTGQGRWLDARRWTYVFEQRPGPGVQCQAKADPGFRALNGEALRGKTQFTFATGGPQVIETFPRSDMVDEDQVFVLRFNGKVKPETVAAHVMCVAQGLGEEIPVRLIGEPERKAILEAAYIPESQRDDSVQLVQCKRRLSADGKVQLIVGRGVATPSGVASDKAQAFDYTVREPFKASFSCQRENANAACTPVSPIVLNFNAPVSSEQAAKIRLKTPNDEVGPQSRDDSYRGSVDYVRFAGPFPERAELKLELPDNIRDDAGRALSNADQFPLSIPMAPFPPLVKFAAAPFGVIERFAYAPAQADSAEPPTVPLSVRNVEGQLRGKELAVSAGKVRDRVTQDDVDVLHWYARLQRLDDGMLTELQLKKIMADRAPAHDKGPAVDVRGFSALAGQADVREMTLPALMEEGADVPLEVIGIPVGEPGFHVLEVESARLGAALLQSAKPMYVRSSALVTNLGVHMKQGRDDVLVWVTTLDQGKVVAGAQINVLDCEGRALASGTTDAQGVWHGTQALAAPSYCESTGLSGVYVSARIPADHPQAYGKADFSFVLSGWNRGIESWRFNVPTNTEPTPTKVTHTVFDRSLLRAGETISMKHYIRVQTRDGLAVPGKDQVLPDTVVIEHQGSGENFELPLVWKPTPSGGLSAVSSYAVPKTAKLGVYAVTLTGTNYRYAQPDGEFRIEEFKLPVLTGGLKISAADGSPLLIAPKSLNADVQISYVSGGPASQLHTSMSAMVRDKALSFDGYDDYSFGAYNYEEDGNEADAGAEAQSLFLDKKPVVLDAHGGARTEIATLPKLGSQPRDLLFEATFADPNGEIQTLSQTATVWPAGVVAGIRAGSWVAQGQDIAVTGLALSPAGKPQADVSMSVSAISRNRYSTRKRMVGGFYSYDSHVETRDLGVVCEGKTNDQGQLPCKGSVKESGEIVLVATARDAQGRVSKATSSVWVVGGDELWFGGANDDRIDIIPEKKVYAPGEIAEFQVRMPFREATALVAVEREGVLSTQVVELSGTDPRVRLTVDPKWGPNVYVSVLALRGRLHEVPWYSFFTWGWKQPGAWFQAYGGTGGKYTAPTGLVDLSKPAFRFGLAEIRVAGKQDQLVVKVSADKPRYQVRDKAEVSIQVSLPDGSPAANGQVAFAAVDEALLALAPNASWDLLDAMRQRRGYGVETATAQMQIVGRRHYGRKALPAGGGGGKSPTRELLDTLLLWKANVPLDEHGAARLTVPLNDSITSFRLVAVADYGAQRFGTGSAAIAATQDVQLISGLPALVREGDAYQAAVTVRNTTQRDMRIQVDAGYAGPGLPAETLAPQLIQVPAGAAQAVNWKVQAPEGNAPDSSTVLNWTLQAREVAQGQAPLPVPARGAPAAAKEAKEMKEAAALAGDRLAFKQALLPSVPITAKQSVLTAVEASRPVHLAVQAPQGSLQDGKGQPRGGLEIYLQPSLAGGLPGVRKWFEAYPYTCLEQLSSKALGLRSGEQWSNLMAQLPDYLDDDGLARYFPGMSRGSEVLTAYLLAASNEAQALGLPFAIPEPSREKMKNGLLAFISGKIVRNRWAPQNDLDVRKLLVLEALSREGAANARMLGSIRIAPDTWPTSAVIDWLAIVSRVPGIPNAAALKEQAGQIIQARMLSRGTELVFADDAQNNWWWLMGSPEVNAAKLILTVIGQPAWDEDMPRLVQGLMARQQNGAWRTTTSNLMASLAMEKFARHFEHDAVSGQVRMQLVPGGKALTYNWPAAGQPNPGSAQARNALKVKAPTDVPVQRYFQPWSTAAKQVLDIEQQGPGVAWASVRSLAAVPVVKPIAAGYDVQRKIVPVAQALPGRWSRGDVYRVQLRITAKTATVWAVLSDPVPAGATILGSGLGRDSAIASTAATPADVERDGRFDRQPSFVERSFEGVRAYYEYLPQGTTTLEYTVRLNTVGSFLLPPTRIEALYQPDVYGVRPNGGGLSVQDATAGTDAAAR